jgi:hypothetical protein
MKCEKCKTTTKHMNGDIYCSKYCFKITKDMDAPDFCSLKREEMERWTRQ